MIKKLREEKRVNNAGSAATIPSEASKESEGLVTRIIPVIAANEPIFNKPNELWENESLFERRITIEGGTGRGRGSVVRLLEDPTGTLAGGNGATLWDCSLALTRILAERYDGYDLTGTVVLELGAGLGLVGMAMAAMGARVVATERAITLPLLRRNVDFNKVVVGGRVDVAELSWGAKETKAFLAERSRSGDPPFDIVIGSDLVFPSNSDAYSLLADTLTVLLDEKTTDAKNSKTIDMWQSHEPRRPDVEAKFWDMLEDRGICARQITLSDGILPNSHPSDITIYKLNCSPSSAAAAKTLAQAKQNDTFTTP